VSERSWSTPLVHREAGRTQVVTNGWRYIAGYDFATGRELWRLRSEGDIPVPTPVAAHGLIYVTNAHGGLAPLYAIRPTASGDISLAGNDRANAHVAWSTPRNGAYMQTPLIHGDLLFSCSDRGVLKCYDARSGKLHYEQRLGAGLTGFSASPVASGGRIYLTSEEGEVFVIAAAPEYQLLAKNLMGETCMATPAVSEGVLYFRTRSRVVAVGAK
jgi:outer membrane protein assembly factor BamB